MPFSPYPDDSSGTPKVPSQKYTEMLNEKFGVFFCVESSSSSSFFSFVSFWLLFGGVRLFLYISLTAGPKKKEQITQGKCWISWSSHLSDGSPFFREAFRSPPGGIPESNWNNKTTGNSIRIYMWLSLPIVKGSTRFVFFKKKRIKERAIVIFTWYKNIFHFIYFYFYFYLFFLNFTIELLTRFTLHVFIPSPLFFSHSSGRRPTVSRRTFFHLPPTRKFEKPGGAAAATPRHLISQKKTKIKTKIEFDQKSACRHGRLTNWFFRIIYLFFFKLIIRKKIQIFDKL